MLLIEGDSITPAFYIGMHEETNIDYATYLKWLREVFAQSYPEVYQKAIPDSVWNNSNFNDPMDDNYFSHPAFSYYPVVGLNWQQIQRYCEWKTDRLNEYILIQEKILNFNSVQLDEDNFNTEAEMMQQYYGNRKSAEKNFVKWEDRIYLPALRLPSEYEWKIAREKILKINKEQLESEMNMYLSSDKYYINLWTKFYGIKGGDNTFFSSNDFGFHNNINEWIYNEYSIDMGQNSAVELYERFSVPNDHNTLEIKDSLGKMPFVVIGEDVNGKPIAVKRHVSSDRIYDMYESKQFRANLDFSYGVPIYSKGKNKVIVKYDEKRKICIRDSMNELRSNSNLGFRCVMYKVD